jgi:hypothetical protein
MPKTAARKNTPIVRTTRREAESALPAGATSDFSNSLLHMMQATRAPFPTFTESQNAAYGQISHNIGADGGVRSRYATKSSSQLDNYGEALINPAVNPVAAGSFGGVSFSTDDFAFVVATLGPELAAAEVVSQWFADVSQMFANMFTAESATLNKDVVAAKLAATPDASCLIDLASLAVTLATSILYVVAEPTSAVIACSVIAGTVLTAAQAVDIGVNWTNDLPLDAYEVEVADLWETLIEYFRDVRKNIDDIKKVMMGNWGNLNALYQMLEQEDFDFDSLKLDIEEAGRKAYETGVLQMLLPVEYCIFQEWVSTDKGTSSKPKYICYNGLKAGRIEWYKPSAKNFQSHTPLLYTPSTTAGPDYPWAVWWIATQADAMGYLNAEVLYEQLNGNEDLFFGRNGWNLPMATADYHNTICFRVANNTSESVLISGLNYPHGPGPISVPDSVVAPFATATIVVARDTYVRPDDVKDEPALPEENSYGANVSGTISSARGKVSCTFAISMQTVRVTGSRVEFSVTNASEKLTVLRTITVDSAVNGYKGNLGGAAVLVIQPSSAYPAPPWKPLITNWTQVTGRGSAGPYWGPYWVDGNQVQYAISFLYADGTESFIGAWGDATTIAGRALAELLVPPLNPFKGVATVAWGLYRRFVVSGSLTTVEFVGVIAQSAARAQPSGTFIISDAVGDAHLAPPAAPGIYSWSQNVGVAPNGVALWGPNWVPGNSVLYAYSYVYADGVASSIGPWTAPQPIGKGALAQLSVPAMPTVSPPVVSWGLYRRFVVNGQMTPIEPLSNLTPGQGAAAMNGGFILYDEGNVTTDYAPALGTQAPLIAPELYDWSQDTGVGADGQPDWGRYWVNGYSVMYALSYVYTDGTESGIGAWTSPVLIAGYALAQLLAQPVPTGVAGWGLYRRFVVEGEVTPVEPLGQVAVSDAEAGPDGTFKLLDQGNVA